MTEPLFLGLAEGKVSRAELAEWYRENTQELIKSNSGFVN